MQQCGSEKVSFTSPNALKKYNIYMRYANLVDFDKKIGGSFTQKGCFKNGMRKAFFE